jgi:hypothetical protein
MADNSIIPAQTAIETFRDAGYKNTASALAELIDNSIEARAQNIQVITVEKEVMGKSRLASKISEIMVYDDGIGMSQKVLSICLQFGNGTRLTSRDGMGRFGIGLPNASISQCKRVEVYSWKKGVCLWTYLDVDEVRRTGQQVVNEVVEKPMPSKLLRLIEGDPKKSGTLIVWKKCDRIDIARASTLFKRMEKDLCRVYRHFLDVDDEYGKRRSVTLIRCGNDRSTIVLKPNDPLYLMTPSSTPGYENAASNILHGDVIRFQQPYGDEGDKAEVQIRFSVALPAIQALGGGSPLGKHYLANTGISFVRAAREIDFGSFGYFNTQDERQRWWGCEVRFEPILDEVFGVTNNKQAVRGVQKLDVKEFKDDHPEDWQEVIEDDHRLFLRQELTKNIELNVKKLMEIVLSRGQGSRGGSAIEKAAQDKSSKIANEDLAASKAKTKSQEEGASKTKEEKSEEWIQMLIGSDTSLSATEARVVAASKIDLVVEKAFSSWPGSQFFSVETTGSTCTLIINRKHPFFSEMYEPLLVASDPRYVDALDLTLMAYARVHDELYERIDDLDEINSVWGAHLSRFLKRLSVDA